MRRVWLDLLPKPFRFWSLTLHQFLLVNDPTTKPPRTLRLLSTSRDLANLLKDAAR